MKYLQYLLFILVVFSSSCDINQKNKAIVQKEAELNQKQQDLLLWEQRLSEREKLLDAKQQQIDSTKKEIDSVAIHSPSIQGRWGIKMQCIETSCDGFAIGDSKTERWEFTTDSTNNIVVKAYAGKNLIRIYNGVYTYDGLKLTENNTNKSNTRIEVTLRMLNNGKMDGTRQIIQTDCKTTYSLIASKQ